MELYVTILTWKHLTCGMLSNSVIFKLISCFSKKGTFLTWQPFVFLHHKHWRCFEITLITFHLSFTQLYVSLSFHKRNHFFTFRTTDFLVWQLMILQLLQCRFTFTTFRTDVINCMFSFHMSPQIACSWDMFRTQLAHFSIITICNWNNLDPLLGATYLLWYSLSMFLLEGWWLALYILHWFHHYHYI